MPLLLELRGHSCYLVLLGAALYSRHRSLTTWEATAKAVGVAGPGCACRGSKWGSSIFVLASLFQSQTAPQGH